MQKPTRGFQDRTNVPEFEENFVKIDAFRTHKYRQFNTIEIDFSGGDVSDKEYAIEANGIFVEYPLEVDIRVNELDSPKLNLNNLRYIGGYVHRIYVTAKSQSPKLKLLCGVDTEVGYLASSNITEDSVTGTAPQITGNRLTWYPQVYASKVIRIKNTGDTNDLAYTIFGYVGDDYEYIDTSPVGIPPGEYIDFYIPEMWKVIQVFLNYVSAATTYKIEYLGSSNTSTPPNITEKELFDISNETTSHTVNGNEISTRDYRFAELALNCSSLTGSSDTLDVKVQAYSRITAAWHDIATFTQLTAAGTQEINLSEGLGTHIRAVYTTGGTVTDCDFKLGVVLKK